MKLGSLWGRRGNEVHSRFSAVWNIGASFFSAGAAKPYAMCEVFAKCSAKSGLTCKDLKVSEI